MLTITMSTNTYSGGTMLDGGILQIGASSTVSGGSVASGPLGIGLLTLSGGTLQDDGNGQTLANAISVNGNVTLGQRRRERPDPQRPNTVAITGSPVITVTAPTTIADQITGGTLVLAGTGTLILGGANVYTGPTAVTAGTLQLGPSPLATAPLIHYTFDNLTGGTTSPSSTTTFANYGSLGSANATMGAGTGSWVAAGRFGLGYHRIKGISPARTTPPSIASPRGPIPSGSTTPSSGPLTMITS